MFKRLRMSLFVVLALVLSQASSLAQCAMCRGAVESTVSSGETSMASNLNLGILYLFFAPYLLVGLIAYFWYKTSRKNVKKAKGLGSIAG